MAYQKVYARINWENYPSEKTPVNEQNLNKIDKAVYEIDDRVIHVDTSKFDKIEAAKLVKDITINEANGVITITKYDNTQVVFDTKLEKIAVNFKYDVTTQRLIITLDDGTIQYVDLASLITQLEFLNSDTIAFTVDQDGKVKAEVREGSIGEKHLRPDYLADIRVESARAEAARNGAETAEKNAKASEDNAAASEAAAAASQTAAAQSEANAKSSESAALQAAQNAAASQTAAAQSEANAAQSEAAALQSANNAAASSQSADASATEAESYAHGGTGTRDGENSDNSLFYSKKSQESADKAKVEADKAEKYAGIVAPDFYIDLETMELYMKTNATVDFIVDEDCVLYWAVA